ncbi:NlpC/P60 family protein [Geomonas agri]|uniref:NlpC/P60 family protein n=1 Tax=Geomonas agri TaxID=2873702 RepID=UPI00384E48E5
MFPSHGNLPFAPRGINMVQRGSDTTGKKGGEMIDLRLGSSGAEVMRLQSLLNRHRPHLQTLEADGILGPRTEAAVREFQSSAGISIDGVVGAKTWAALERGVTTASEVSPVPFHDALWLKIAAGEVGQREFPRSPANPRIIIYHGSTSLRATSDEVAWCSAFVNWCLRQAGITGTNSAAATSWLHWGQMTCPKPGAITVVRKNTGQNHVSFYIDETRDYYKLLGGNQGDQVRISNYYKSHWVAQGHRWPKPSQS